MKTLSAATVHKCVFPFEDFPLLGAVPYTCRTPVEEAPRVERIERISAHVRLNLPLQIIAKFKKLLFWFLSRGSENTRPDPVLSVPRLIFRVPAELYKHQTNNGTRV